VAGRPTVEAVCSWTVLCGSATEDAGTKSIVAK